MKYCIVCFCLGVSNCFAADIQGVWAMGGCAKDKPILALTKDSLTEYQNTQIKNHQKTQMQIESGVIDVFYNGKITATFEPLGDSGLRVLDYKANNKDFSGKVLIKCPKLSMT